MLTARAEREMLNGLLARFEAHGPAIADAADDLVAGLPVSLRDQHAAAIRDAHQRTLDLGRLRGFGPERTVQPGPRLAALVLAAAIRCLAGHHCPHTTGTPTRPLTLWHAARVATCDGCFARFRGPMLASDRRIAGGSDRQCDLCLDHQPPGASFWPHVVHVGPSTLALDVCADCHEIAGEARQAVAS